MTRVCARALLRKLNFFSNAVKKIERFVESQRDLLTLPRFELGGQKINLKQSTFSKESLSSDQKFKRTIQWSNIHSVRLAVAGVDLL